MPIERLKPEIINIGTHYLNQDELFNLLYERSPRKEYNQNIIQGIAFFLVKKNLILTGDITSKIEQILHFLEKLEQLTNGKDFYKSNCFKYIYEGKNLEEVLEQILKNAQFWIKRFGVDFFERASPQSKNRKTIMSAEIDDDFYLSCKGGSGVGTFSVDLAIGIQKKNNPCPYVPSGELWRTGMDTQTDKKKTSLRIIRTGAAFKKGKTDYKRKSKMYRIFKKRYGVSPQRALAFLSMFIGKDLEVDEIKAITLEGAQQKRLSLVDSSQVNYDYTSLFKSVGFQESDNPNWTTMGNPQTNFYPTLETDPHNLNGLRAYETTGLDKIIDAFRNLQDIMNAENRCPLIVCQNETKKEIKQAMNTFRTIHNK